MQIKKVGNYYIFTSKENILGSGTQATVYLAKRSTDELTVAAKIFDMTQNFSEKDQESIKRQLDILFTTKHPYILECYDFIQTKHNIYLFSEYCNGGDLQQYIESRPYISEAECLDLFKQIVSALQVLDKNNIAHRDLKPANILLNKGQVKIADFGYAKRIQTGNVKNTYVGSPIFMSPQALNGGHYDLKKADVWSAGVCLYYMLFKKYPFESQKEDLEELKQVVWQAQLTFPENQKRSKLVKELLLKMLEKDEERRFDWNQVAAHDCLNYNSSINVNPLLRSSELNQVCGISSYNQNLKDQALVTDKPVIPTNQQTIQKHFSDSELDSTSKQFSQQREKQKGLILVHNLLVFFSIFPQKYQDIWRQIKIFNDQSILDQLGEIPKKSLILLMCTHFISSRMQMQDLILRSQVMIQQHVNRIKPIYTPLLPEYFQQENYKSFIQNLRIQNQVIDQISAQTKPELVEILKKIGFNQSFENIEKDIQTIIELAIFNLIDYIEPVCKQAVNSNNKIILSLFSNLLTLMFYQEKIQNNQFDFDTYDQLIQKLESLNFASLNELFLQICEYQKHFKQQNEEEDEDDK
ncbi:hypothetical protein ABPG73_013203 [Tetrahymena malaccensis]